MGQEPDLAMLEDLLELKSLLQKEWPARNAALHASGTPLNEGDDDDDGQGADDDSDDRTGQDDSDDDAGQTFDAAYVKKLRDEAARHRREAREAQQKVKDFEDQGKSDAQRLEDRAATAETRAAEAERELARARVALRKGLTESQARRLIGDTEEELEADADELLATFQQADEDDQESLRRTPRERLRPGATARAEPEEDDPAKLAAMVPRRYGT